VHYGEKIFSGYLDEIFMKINKKIFCRILAQSTIEKVKKIKKKS
jgi:hypothetical protein